MSDQVQHSYAKAYFELVSNNQAELKGSLNALLELSQVSQNNSSVHQLLSEPTVPLETKLNLIYKLCPSLKDFATLGKLFSLLGDKKKLAYVLELGPSLQRILDEHHNISKIEIITAQKLQQNEIENIKKSLEKSLGQEIQLKETIDESLIAGMVIQTEEYVIDNSLKGRLKNLSQAVY
jgi:F-type H+-transporting ATPase subunit delta